MKGKESIVEKARREAATGNHVAYGEPPAGKGDAYDGTGEPPRKRVYDPRLYTSPEFFRTDFRREWLVKGVLVRDELAVLGGPKKVLKSGVGIDLAISLDTATPFLGFEQFAVPQRVNVMVLNGESGDATVQETAARIARERGIDPESLRITWGSELPQLTNLEHLKDLGDIIRERRSEGVIIDPAYLCLLAGSRADGPQTSNLNDMGPVYSQFAQSVLKAGATPILTMHAKKNIGDRALDLDDLTYAGIAEFARQWILLSRHKSYEGDGKHCLWLNLGGSAGHSFLGFVDIDEGMIDEQFNGRKWKTEVSGYQESKRERKAERESKKADEQRADEQIVIQLIDDSAADGEVASLTSIRNGSGLSRDRTDRALERLRRQKLVVAFQAKVKSGNKALTDATAYRRVDED